VVNVSPNIQKSRDHAVHAKAPLRCLVAFIAVLATLPAHAASMDSLLDSMFYRTSTDPGAYESQRRTGYVAGSMSFRAPVRTYNILAFDPPRIRAGCSGLDLFGGSFSFINGEQLKLLIKQIGSAALGYAVYLAINEMCKPCGATLSFLQKMMTELNSTNLNSCKIAKGMVDYALDPSSFKEVASQRDGTISRIRGYFSDWTKEMEEGFKNPEKSSKYADLDASGNTSTNPDNPMKGNLVWRALYRDRVGNAIGDPNTGAAGTIDVQMAEYLMSITGTYVVPMVGSTTGCPDTTGSGSSTNPYPQECLPHAYEPLISFNELLHGTSGVDSGGTSDFKNKLQFWKCQDSTSSPTGCQRLAKAPFTFAGTLSYVHSKIFGHMELFHNQPNDESILSRIARGESLTSDQIAFLQTIPFPLYGMLQKLRKRPYAMYYFATMAERPIADMLVVTLGQSIIRVANQVFSGHSEVTPPPDWGNRIAQIEAALAPYVARSEQQMQDFNNMVQVAENILSSFPQPLVTVPQAK
jgi:conjugative transfer pilus assembly protein TraH